MTDHQIRRADPSDGFDHREPKAVAIVGIAIAGLLVLVGTILALQLYFNHIWDQAVYEKVLAPPSEQLKELHNREDWNLTHFGYNKKAGTVRIPVDRAMEVFVKEAAAGKLFYPAKPYEPKKEEPEAGRE